MHRLAIYSFHGVLKSSRHLLTRRTANGDMAVDKTTAIVVSAILFGAFVLIWILTLIFCKCREPSSESTSRSDRRFTPEEERMIRQNSERRAKNYRDGPVPL